MKKLIFLLILLFISAVTPAATQTIQRTDKMPGFFVPKNALKTKPTQEKLPSVEAMRYKGISMPLTQEQIQARQQRLAEEQKKAEQQKKQEQLNNLVQQKIQQHQRSKPADKPVIIQDMPKEQPIVEQPPVLPTEKLARATTKKQPYQDEKVEQIIKEYKENTKSISNRQPFSNPRLKNMIADYKNIDRKI